MELGGAGDVEGEVVMWLKAGCCRSCGTAGYLDCISPAACCPAEPETPARIPAPQPLRVAVPPRQQAAAQRGRAGRLRAAL